MNSNINNNNINFGTNIKFISPNDFNKVKKSFMFKHSCPATYNYNLDMVNQGKKCYRVGKEKNYTQGIKNCTGLVVADSQKYLNCFFAHFFPSPKNYNRLQIIEPYLKGTNAVLVGSKSTCSFSDKMYEEIKNICKRKNMSITGFKDFNQEWEADIAYEAKKDNLYICLKQILFKKDDISNYVDSMNKLKLFCNEITISDKDNIEFIKDGNLQVETWLDWTISKTSFLLGKLLNLIN